MKSGDKISVKEESLKDKAVKGLFWSFIDRGGQQVISLVIGLILANLLFPSDFGLIGCLAIFTVLSTTLIDSGFGNALIKEKNEPSIDDYSTIFYFNVFLSLFIYLVLFISAPLIAGYFENEVLTNLSRIVFLPIIINSIGLIQHIQLIRKVSFRRIATISFISLLVSGLAAIICALNGLGVYSLAIQLLLQASLKTGLLWFYSSWKPKGKVRLSVLKKYFSYGSKITIVGIMNSVLNNLPILFIGKYYDMKQVGYITYAQKLYTIPGSAIIQSMQDVTFPVLSRISETERTLRVLRKTLKTAAFLLFPVLWGLAAISESFFHLFLKEEWYPSILMLQIFCFSSPFSLLCVIHNNLLLSKGKSGLYLGVEIFKKIILLFCFLLSIQKGILEIVIAISLANVLYYLASAITIRKVIEYSFFSQIKDILPYIAISAIMGTAVYSISFIGKTPYIIFPLQILIGIFIYWLLCYKLGSKIYGDVIEEVKKRLPFK